MIRVRWYRDRKVLSFDIGRLVISCGWVLPFGGHEHLSLHLDAWVEPKEVQHG